MHSVLISHTTHTMSSTSLLNIRSSRVFSTRLRPNILKPSIQIRAKATAPFRLPDPRNEPNVSTCGESKKGY